MLKIAVIGAGARGQNAYAPYALDFPDQIEIVAAVDPKQEQLDKISVTYNIDSEMLFNSEDEFYELGKICDAVIVANMDKDHFYTAMKCLDLGYDILLEKPITPSKEQLELLEQKVLETGCKVLVCYVLRYTPYFRELKELVQNKVIGDVIGIDHTEYIGNYHMAHSFVRGNWRNDVQTSPIILQKTSHDLDILAWLIESDYDKVFSSGKLNYFKEENAPLGATKKCLDCPHKDNCNYNAEKFYIDPLPGGWANNVIANVTVENVTKLLADTNYGTCVYKVDDNNVCDHQVSLIKFKNGIDVTFTLTAFHQNQARFTRIFGTKGSIIADGYENSIKVTKNIMHANEKQDIQVIYPTTMTTGHGGGDTLIMKDFIGLISGEIEDENPFEESLLSHYLAYDLEKSRVEDCIISNKK